MNFQRNTKLASLRQEKEAGFQKVKKYRIDEEDSEEFID
jgi:ribonuclease E